MCVCERVCVCVVGDPAESLKVHLPSSARRVLSLSYSFSLSLSLSLSFSLSISLSLSSSPPLLPSLPPPHLSLSLSFPPTISLSLSCSLYIHLCPNLTHFHC